MGRELPSPKTTLGDGWVARSSVPGQADHRESPLHFRARRRMVQTKQGNYRPGFMNIRKLARRRSGAKPAFCAGLLVIAALTPVAAGSDAKAVQGGWTPVKAELSGQPMDDAVLKTISLKLRKGHYEVSVAGRLDKGNYAIDPSTKPKRMTVTGTEGPNQGKTFPATYELEGDTLRVCYDLSGRKRPAEFKTSADTQLYLVTYQRRRD